MIGSRSVLGRWSGAQTGAAGRVVSAAGGNANSQVAMMTIGNMIQCRVPSEHSVARLFSIFREEDRFPQTSRRFNQARALQWAKHQADLSSRSCSTLR